MNAIFTRKRVPYRQIDGYSIIHLATQKIFLNAIATRIWELIDGNHTAEDIASVISIEKNTPFDPRKVTDTLETLYGSRLLVRWEDGKALEASINRNDLKASRISTWQDPTAAEKQLSQSAVEACMTPEAKQAQPRTLSDKINTLYWTNHYIQKMHLELTYRCNFRCVQCYNTTHAGTESEMSVTEWESVLGQLAKMGCYLLTFTGGEVFVRKDACEILQLACDHGFTFRINTNASLITEQILAKLEHLRPYLQCFDISIYGADQAVHDKLTKRLGSYVSTMKALHLLVEAKMPVFPKYITMQDNFHQINKFMEDMKELGVPHAVSTGSLIPRTNRDSAPLVQILTDEQYQHLLDTRPMEGLSDPGHCKPGHIRGAITPSGFVSPCEWLTDFKLGNVRTEPLRDIWYSREFLQFRKIFEEDSECPSCSLRPGCGRCPAMSYLETGDLLKCAPVPRHQAELYQQFRVASV